MTRWQRFVKALPLGLALTTVAGVWLAGAAWSFEEQTRLAGRLLFAVPWLLPLVLDGLAISLAGVAYAASLDGRAAVQARLMTAVAVLASATSNAAGAWSRTTGDPLAVVIAAGVPVAANLAFEVLLGELRRQVHRRRGLPAPVAVPYPRAVRLALSPVGTVREWRSMVLDLTAPAKGVHSVTPLPAGEKGYTLERTPADPPVAEPRLPAEPRPEPVRRSVAARSTRRATVSSPTLPADVLEVGREVAAELAAAGQALTNRALIAGFRARQRPLSSGRAQTLAQVLRTS